jgi:hypothetical protein
MGQFQAKSRRGVMSFAMLPSAFLPFALLFGGMLLTGCAPQQNPPVLSASSVVMSPDILVKRTAGMTASTEDATSIAAVPDTDIERSDDAASDVATTVIDPIIWQIQTGSAASAPPDPVIPQGQDPSLT